MEGKPPKARIFPMPQESPTLEQINSISEYSSQQLSKIRPQFRKSKSLEGIKPPKSTPISTPQFNDAESISLVSNSTSTGISNKEKRKGNIFEQKMAEKVVAEKMEERNKIRGRRGNAANFMDTQIKKVIDIIKGNGGSITFGVLFKDTADKMDALSAVLHTAKKRGNLDYDGVMLMQGQSDGVIIKLLKETVEETKVYQSAMYDTNKIAEAIQTPKGPEMCFICSKTVYPTERIAPNSNVMHKSCFRCKECNSLLRIDAYCKNNGKFYCKPDYERLVKNAGGSYQF